MARIMVGQRKGGAVAAPDDAGTDDGTQGDSAGDTPDDVETCPNCDCQFTDADDGGKPTVIKPGKPVQDGESGYKGADLDASGSAPPVPGPEGAAHDASLGQSVMAALLNGQRGMVGTHP